MDTSNSVMIETSKARNSMISTIDRKRIYFFVGITYGITIALALVIFFNGGVYSNYPASFKLTEVAAVMLFASMFAPSVAHIATRLITREGWSNTFLRPNLRRGWPFYLAAWTLPLLTIILGGAIYYLLLPGKFDLSMQWARTALIPPQFAKESWTVAISHTILEGYRNVLIAMFLFLGEEFGWRAYLLPKLMPLGPRKAVLLVGAIWGVFHWPAILMGYEYGFGYWGAPVTGLLLFVLVLMIDSTFYAWLTLRTGSVWPACIAHGVHNNVGPIMAFFLSGEINRMIGPAQMGIVGCLGSALLALLIFLSPRALAPVDRTISKNPVAVEKAADQIKFGTIS
jgi:uncharacterized protein